jgi:hypothetical protein
MKKRKQKAPYAGRLFMRMPDNAERSVKLPPASAYELGEKIVVEHEYKTHRFRVPLVRVEGGWDVVESKR